MNRVFQLIFIFLCAFKMVEGCTAFQLKAQDGSFLYCRTLEFGYKFNSEILVVPQGTEYTGTALGQPGLKWKTKYGFVGMNQSMEKTLVSDGMNEKGLVIGVLYLPTFAQYEAPDNQKKDRTLGCWELPSFLLSTCTTVEEVKAALPTVLVAQQPPPGMGDFILPIHYYISDKSGTVIIVEYVGGQRHIYDDPMGVLTNSPPFDWHLNNLANYVNLAPVNEAPVQFANWTVPNIGQGSGLLGLPGDYTSPSRFIRATLFSQWATPQKTALDAVNLGFHLLNSFDIPDGLVQSRPDAKNVSHTETTEWVIVHDKTNLKTYFRGYKSLRIQMVDLKKIDFTKAGFKTVPIMQEFSVDDVTPQLKPLKQ
jgi:choloylglycine hydrolase